MESAEIKKMCLNCMHMSKEDEFCPVCGKPKKGVKTFDRALEPGTILNGKILIGNILGMGNFGITYMGFDMLLEYRVAVKEFFPDDMVEREIDSSLRVAGETTEEEYIDEVREFQREARILAQFSKHPGIVSIKELFYENNTGYLVMEYLEGGTLRRYIDNNSGHLTVEHALELMEPVITSMEEVHKSGLIHRDISPENIMLDDDGSIKVIDFGATKKLSNKTAQVYIGKFGYAALEQMLGEGQGPWTDVYGICATLYCMITGDIPADAYSRSLGEEELVPITEYGYPIPKRVSDAIMKGLSMECRDRQQDMGQLKRSLYGVKTSAKEEKETVQFPKADAMMIYDVKNRRVWFGHYPMNEVTGSKLTTDIIYANFDLNENATILGKKYKRFVPNTAIVSSAYKNANRQKIKEDSKKGRIFEYSEIPWIILYQSGNKMILQSEYILDYQMFDERDYINLSEREIQKIRTGISWETSRIREWLNRDFMKEAFTPDEQKRILVKEVKTPISSFTDEITYDRIFLPSVEEVNSGFDARIVRGGNGTNVSEKSGHSMASQFCAAKRIDESLPMGYALRTRGTINANNNTFTYGESCDGHSIQGGKLKNWRLDAPMGIRPVIQVDITDIMEV